MNLARICPPDLPNLEQGSGEIDTHLLRPELVQSLPRPLSADAYSRVIGNPGDKTNNDIEVGLASQHLLEEVIPAFTQQLDSLALMPCDSLSFTRELHEAGINVSAVLVCLCACVFVSQAPYPATRVLCGIWAIPHRSGTSTP